MSRWIVVSVTACAALGAACWRLQRRVRAWRRWHAIAVPYIIRSGAPVEEIEPLLAPDRWRTIATGGDTREGRIAGIRDARCPCQSEYTVTTVQTPINVWPNPQQVAACMANLPAPRPAEWRCAEDCVQVLTHVWHGWSVVQHVVTDELTFNCLTFAQYHCKKPDDPERERPPRPHHPDGPDVEA